MDNNMTYIYDNKRKEGNKMIHLMNYLFQSFFTLITYLCIWRYKNA